MGGEFFVGGVGEFGFAELEGDVTKFGARDEAAKVLITGLAFGEEGEAVRGKMGGRSIDFGTDEGADIGFLGGTVEAGGSVDAVSVGKGHGGLLQLGAGGGEVLGERCTFEEGEGRTGVEFNERHGLYSIIGEEKANFAEHGRCEGGSAKKGESSTRFWA